VTCPAAPTSYPVCLVPGCLAPAKCRGLCSVHLRRLRERICAGELTYTTAEAAGLCLPAMSKAEVGRRFNSRQTIFPPFGHHPDRI